MLNKRNRTSLRKACICMISNYGTEKCMQEAEISIDLCIESLTEPAIVIEDVTPFMGDFLAMIKVIPVDDKDREDHKNLVENRQIAIDYWKSIVRSHQAYVNN